MNSKFTIKVILGLALLTAISIGQLHAQTPYVHYTFDTDGSDAKGNADLTSGPNVTFVSDAVRGNVAQTTTSDAESDATMYAASGDWFVPGNTEYSITAWVILTERTNWWGALWSYGNKADINNAYTYFTPSAGAEQRMGILSVNAGFDGEPNYNYNFNGGIDRTDGIWRHIAVTENAGTINVYFDGVLSASGTAATTIADKLTTGLDTFNIGRHVHSTKERLTVKYDDFKVFHTALTAAQIIGQAANIVYETSFSATPISTDNLRIAGAYAEAADLEVNTLFVESGASLTVKSGQTVTVNGDFYNEGTVTVESGASLITKGAVSGSAVIHRTTTFDMNTGKYSVVGSPVISGTTSSLGTNATVYSYDESIAYGADGASRFQTVASGTTMAQGVGYFSAFTGDGTGEVIFSGVPNAGDVSVSTTFTDRTDANDGFNLVANPYPCAIDINAFTQDASNSGITGSVWLWNDNNDVGTRGSNSDYIVVNSSGVVDTDSDAGGGSGFDGSIRSMQGFFVKATAAGSVTFKDAHKVSGENSDGFFFRKDEGSFTRLKLSVRLENSYNEMLIAFREEGADGIDRLDATQLGVNSGLRLYSHFDNQAFAIQTLGILNTEKEIALGLNIEEDGLHVFNVEEMRSLPVGMNVYLLDKLTQTEYDLTNGESVSLSLSKGTYNDRFTIRFRVADVLSNNNLLESDLVVFKNQGQLNVRFSAMDIANANIRLFNMSGSEIAKFDNQTIQNGAWKTVLNLRPGIYVLKSIDNLGNTYSIKFAY